MSTNEADVLDLLGKAKTPVEQVLAGIGVPPSDELGDPYDLLTQFPRVPLGRSDAFDIHIGPGIRFGRGVAKGIVEPLTLLGAPDPDERGPFADEVARQGPGVAGTLGYLAGAGLSFFPVLGATRAATGAGLRAVGLAERISPLKQLYINETVASGLWEAGTVDELKDVPKAFGVGAAVGAALFGSLHGAARAWRAKFPKTVAEGAVEEVPIRAIPVEDMIHPNVAEGVDDFMIRVRLAESGKSMEVSSTQLAGIMNPGGGVLLDLPQASGVQKLIQQLRTRLPEGFQFDTYFDKSKKTMSVLVHDSRARSTVIAEALTPLDQAGREITETPLRTAVLKFLGEGDPALNPGQMEALLANTAVDDFVPKVRLSVEEDFTGMAQAVTNVDEGSAAIVLSKVVAEQASGAAKSSLMAHEMTHWLTETLARRAGRGAALEAAAEGGTRAASRVQLEDVFGELPENLANRVRRELANATEEKLARLRVGRKGDDIIEEFTTSPTRRDKEIAKSIVDSNPSYYSELDEQLSRLTELMFLSPAAARKVAPTVVRMWGDVIQRESPKLTKILTKKEFVLANDLLVEKFGRGAKILGDQPVPLTPKRRAEFRANGVFEGQRIIYNGEEGWQFVRKLKDGRWEIFNGGTGKSKITNPRNVQRNVIPRLIARDLRVADSLERVVLNAPSWMGTMVRDADGVVRHATVELEHFTRVDNLEEFISSVRRELTDVEKRELGALEGGHRAWLVRKGLEREGTQGLIVSEGGVHQIQALPEAITLGRRIDEAFVSNVDGTMNDFLVNLDISFDNAARTALADAGVASREIPYYLDQLRETYRETWLDIVDEEFRTLYDGVKEIVEDLPQSLDDFASRSDMRVVEGEIGKFTVVSRRNGSALGRFDSEEAAEEFISTRLIADHTAPELDHGSPVVSKVFDLFGGPSPARPPGLNEVVDFAKTTTAKDAIGYVSHVFEVSTKQFGVLTSPAAWFEMAQRFGKGMVKEIYDITQEGLKNVRNAMHAPMPEFGGLSMREQLDGLGRLSSFVKRERRKVVTGWVQAASKEMLEAPGGMIERGMTKLEIDTSNKLTALGHRDTVPDLIHKEAHINREAKALGRDFFEVLRTQEGISDDVKEAIGILHEGRLAGKDKFSSALVSRHASAPSLGKKDPRKVWAQEQRMNAAELKLAQETDKFFKVLGEISGIDSARHIRHYFPEMKKWGRRQIPPTDVIVKDFSLPNWYNQRFRAGELGNYDTDPIRVMAKYAKGMMMDRHMKHVMKRVEELRKTVTDKRTARVLDGYLDEVIGRPSESFERVEDVISDLVEMTTGRALDRGTLKRWIDTHNTLTYGAMLIFRPVTMLRNVYEVVGKVAPRLGTEAFHHGVNATWAEGGFEAARKAGAISFTEVGPAGFADDILGSASMRGMMTSKGRRIMDTGRSWYKRSDDIPRAVAYHAMTYRIGKHIGAFKKGKLTPAQFLQESKLSTFSPDDQRIFFEKLDALGSEEATRWASVLFSDEVIGRFGLANHPLGWGGVSGRLFGQFGTWTVQYKDFLVNGLTRGTTRDKVEFLVGTAAVHGGTLAVGEAVGVDLFPWVALPALQYTGGPMASVTTDMMDLISGSDFDKRMARASLKRTIIPTFDSPTSMYIPASSALDDVVSIFRQDDNEFFGFRGLETDPNDSWFVRWTRVTN